MVKQIDDGSNPSVCSRLKSSSYQMLVGELRHREIWNVSHSATKNIIISVYHEHKQKKTPKYFTSFRT